MDANPPTARSVISVMGRIGWILWDAAGIASMVAFFTGVPILALWFPIYFVGTIAVLCWRYRNGRYRIMVEDRRHS